ncbi:CLUMA_CG008056, isoform A [Clunio marinus]|uniref:CLUMA_CG008056, isoform A n=1 Tax=Clunio marinus TaxID=568069 RepID=A0A1J1I470_9DIPT|nr:CLUMA_CG008056, isoform A [Clunio marinus]
MTSLLTFAFILLLNSLSSTANHKCSIICPDVIPFDADTPIHDLFLANLMRDGPADGVCLEGKDKWIANGTVFGLPPKCICLQYLKGKDNKPGEGPKCPNHLAAALEETIQENLMRNYELLGDVAPEDGWCPEGKIKWIISTLQYSIPKDICVCIDGFEYFSPEVTCIDMEND